MKVVGKGDHRQVAHECSWCGEYINELEGDDKTTHDGNMYHYGCFEEMMDENRFYESVDKIHESE